MCGCVCGGSGGTETLMVETFHNEIDDEDHAGETGLLLETFHSEVYEEDCSWITKEFKNWKSNLLHY